jgi:peptidoglycan/LPS O-acetylase OafA/YrhL
MTTPTPSNQTRPSVSSPRAVRFAALDGLRFFAAVAVVLFHFTARTTDAWPEPVSDLAPWLFRLSKFGYFGVDLFFVISGFVILMSAWGRTTQQFAASRISRLYPAYWAGVIITSGVLLLSAREEFDVSRLLVNLTMTQSAFGIPNIDGVYWTLWVELRFYLLIGVFILVGITTRRVLLFSASWPIIAFIAERSESHLVQTLLIPHYASLFAGGMLLYVIHRNGHSFLAWMLLLANVAWAVPTAGNDARGAVLDTTGAGVSPDLGALVIVLCFAAVAITTLTPLVHLRWRWLTVLGVLTYPLYLLHEQIGWAVIRSVAPHASWPLTLTAALVTSLVLAVLVNRLVEVPFANRLRDRLSTELGGASTRAKKTRESAHRR